MGHETTQSHFPREVDSGQRGALAFPISQVSLNLGNGVATLATAQREILKWMSDRAGRPLPEESWRGESFELEEIGAQHVEAVAIDNPRFWAARLDDADKNVPSRSWVTEVALGQDSKGNIVFGARLTAVIRGPRFPFDRTIPGFVRQVVKATGASLNGRMVTDKPWSVTSRVDVDFLASLIRASGRKSDVIVISSLDTMPHHFECVVNVFDLVRRTLGIAHIAVVNPSAAEWLAQEIGQEFSVASQSVRVFRPGFNEQLDEPFAHPLASAKEILTWPEGGSAAYNNVLVSKSLTKSVAHEEAHKIVPSFIAVKQAAARIRIASVTGSDHSDYELAKLYERENESLRKNADYLRSESDALLIIAEQERDAAVASTQQAQENIRHLRRRIESLEAQAGDKFYQSASIPDDLFSIKDWCEKELAGSVFVHSRAYRGLKASEFNDISMIYNFLLMLRDVYVLMKRDRGDVLIERFRHRCVDLGLDEEPTGSESRAGEYGDEYYVRYEGRRVYLDRHFKKGISREARNCFRAYFFWDDGSKQVVLGWLPSHLETRIS